MYDGSVKLFRPTDEEFQQMCENRTYGLSPKGMTFEKVYGKRYASKYNGLLQIEQVGDRIKHYELVKPIIKENKYYWRYIIDGEPVDIRCKTWSASSVRNEIQNTIGCKIPYYSEDVRINKLYKMKGASDAILYPIYANDTVSDRYFKMEYYSFVMNKQGLLEDFCRMKYLWEKYDLDNPAHGEDVRTWILSSEYRYSLETIKQAKELTAGESWKDYDNEIDFSLFEEKDFEEYLNFVGDLDDFWDNHPEL